MVLAVPLTRWPHHNAPRWLPSAVHWAGAPAKPHAQAVHTYIPARPWKESVHRPCAPGAARRPPPTRPPSAELPGTASAAGGNRGRRVHKPVMLCCNWCLLETCRQSVSRVPSKLRGCSSMMQQLGAAARPAPRPGPAVGSALRASPPPPAQRTCSAAWRSCSLASRLSVVTSLLLKAASSATVWAWRLSFTSLPAASAAAAWACSSWRRRSDTWGGGRVAAQGVSNAWWWVALPGETGRVRHVCGPRQAWWVGMPGEMGPLCG